MSQPTTLTYDDAGFRSQCPFFADPTLYPAAALAQFFGSAGTFLGAANYGWLRDGDRQAALNYMAAHLAGLNDAITANAGTAPAPLTGATVEKVRVSLQLPPAGNQWRYWLGLTPWGQLLLALLQAKSAGGWSTGGLPERAAFRRVGGVSGLRF